MTSLVGVAFPEGAQIRDANGNLSATLAKDIIWQTPITADHFILAEGVEMDGSALPLAVRQFIDCLEARWQHEVSPPVWPKPIAEEDAPEA